MAKVINRGLLPPDDPIYQRGWTLYLGPQPTKPSATPSEETPQKPPEKAPAKEKAEE
jgi:hypothetical protein